MIPPLCFITDADAPLPIVDQAEQAARGGAVWVQLRHKTLDDAGFADLAKALRARLDPLGAKLILNDRLEIACTLGCFGVHVGQSDGDPAEIRARIGPDAVLGLSIETPAQMAEVPLDCVTYLGVGPVRATASKPDHAHPLGFDGLADITRAAALPCMAIGGLTAADVASVRRAGCTGIAVVSAISRAREPERAARGFLDQWSDI
ncbi:thiamine phosphate synthase [Marinovum sp. 2_MG-2023]|uniref:thiamine phosphate synthase n=1 Tax=unclassified Marinovum TaxID=2647166 RepID=UPI0026E11D3A|nr:MULTISPECIES: thiamine phosphate synthase [unclassified Marinovum]MDO6731867.1 thiamine phosphate synthase [Marinovum sp. 2_MG-2023]MDO6781119.1 thiamine phosphate synthase [Marinovum sp. 1_MG-2023]